MSVASTVIGKFLSLATLAKAISADAGNGLKLGTDGLLLQGPPAGLKLLKTEFFTATSLVSNNAGWTKTASARWVVVIVVGGGGSGCDMGNTGLGYSGGEPGSVEIWAGWASDLPATADIVVGAGGAGATGYNSKSGYAAGTASKFGALIQANGGRGGGDFSRVQTVSGSRVSPMCSLRLGAPGVDGAYTVMRSAEDTMLGPGAGGAMNGSGGASSAARLGSRVAGGAWPSSGTTPGNGSAAVAGDPWSFGSGGAGCNANTPCDGGAGGAPGGGGGGGYYNSSQDQVYGGYGAGGRGEVRVLTYG